LFITPAETAVEVGGSFRLSCPSSSLPRWSGPIEEARTYKLDFTLTISGVTEKNAGTYECHGEDSNKRPFISSATVYVART